MREFENFGQLGLASASTVRISDLFYTTPLKGSNAPSNSPYLSDFLLLLPLNITTRTAKLYDPLATNKVVVKIDGYGLTN